ncbi:MAG: hypothetical protein H6719_05390 [Sandaracinaceae bacterium]|nr:hypothetical protein [Sandaracinaceae bacterium]
MGMLDELAIEGADRIERNFGKRAALVALAPVLDSMPEGKARARAHLRVMVLSADLDPARFELLVVGWETERHGKHAEVRRALRSLLREGAARPAIAIARAEVKRTEGTFHAAAAAYLLGLALEAAGDAGALALYDRAAELAGEQPRLQQRARVRALRRCSAPDEAARRAQVLLPLSDGPPADRLAVATAALASSGRYPRAAALDVLEELAAGEGAVARHARARAAVHAESASLSAIEADRLRTVLAHGADAEELAALGSLLRLAAGDPGAARGEEAIRARAVLDGCAPGPRPPGGRLLTEWLALAIVHASHEGRVNEARELLREAHYRIAGGARVEAPLWTAVRVAMPVAPEPARALTKALLARSGAEPPPRGFLPLADAWLATGVTEEGLALLRRAARDREPGAKGRLAAQLRAAGWAAAAEGRRDEAIDLLREAKHLAG